MNRNRRNAEMICPACLAAAILALAWLTGCGAPGPLLREQQASSSAESRPPPAPEAYRVARGDTLYSIAFSYGLDWRRVARWNGISAPYTIHVDDWLRLQPPPDMRPAVVAAETPETEPEERPATEPGPEPASAKPTGPSEPESSDSGTASTPAEPAPDPAPASRKPEADSVSAAATRTVAGVAWRWPARGSIARRFDPGASRKGILIAGAADRPVRAAADGKVVYSGNGLIGYGELIIIKHSDRMLSAYAHNRERLVDEGAHVRAGQLIARMGNNERDESVLHFEIRRDGKPDDPINYLPSR